MTDAHEVLRMIQERGAQYPERFRVIRDFDTKLTHDLKEVLHRNLAAWVGVDGMEQEFFGATAGTFAMLTAGCAASIPDHNLDRKESIFLFAILSAIAAFYEEKLPTNIEQAKRILEFRIARLYDGAKQP